MCRVLKALGNICVSVRVAIQLYYSVHCAYMYCMIRHHAPNRQSLQGEGEGEREGRWERGGGQEDKPRGLCYTCHL